MPKTKYSSKKTYILNGVDAVNNKLSVQNMVKQMKVCSNQLKLKMKGWILTTSLSALAAG